MAVRAIVPIGHPILRSPTRPVEPAEIASDEIKTLIDDLIDTMRAAAGAGIAANQISSDRRVAVIEVNDNPRYPYKPPIPLTVIVNPSWEPVDDVRFDTNEGCLSVPLRGDMQRYETIRVRYIDREGAPRDEVVRGLTAGTFQHEIDHLDGRLIVDHIDPRTLSTWEQFDVHRRAGFVQQITAYAARIGS